MSEERNEAWEMGADGVEGQLGKVVMYGGNDA
jgi:hypothetical protein